MIEVIPAGKLWVDESYQRPESPSRIKSIADNFDPDLLQVLEVSRREDGVNAIIDGQTRAKAAIQKFGPSYDLNCRIITGITLQQEAELFVKFQQSRKALTPIDLYNASLVAQDELSLKVQNILARLGLRVAGGGKRGSISAVKALLEVAGKNPESLSRNLEILRSAWGDDPKTYVRLNILGMNAFLRAYPKASDERMIKVLSAQTPESIEREVKRFMGGVGGGGGNHSLPYMAVFRKLYNTGLRSAKLGKSDMDIEEIETK